MSGIDPEIRAVVRAMNRKSTGMRTIDSCFGHPGSNTLNHQNHAFVGFHPTNALAMRRFWRSFWRALGRPFDLTEYTWARTSGGGMVQFGLCKLDPLVRARWPGGFFRVEINPMHDPAKARGRKEKVEGLEVLREFCVAYK